MIFILEDFILKFSIDLDTSKHNCTPQQICFRKEKKNRNIKSKTSKMFNFRTEKFVKLLMICETREQHKTSAVFPPEHVLVQDISGYWALNCGSYFKFLLFCIVANVTSYITQFSNPQNNSNSTTHDS